MYCAECALKGQPQRTELEVAEHILSAHEDLLSEQNKAWFRELIKLRQQDAAVMIGGSVQPIRGGAS